MWKHRVGNSPRLQGKLFEILLFGGLMASAAGCNGTVEPGISPEPSPTVTPGASPTVQSQLTLSSHSINFGNVQAGQAMEQVIELTNSGTSPLLLTVTLPVNPGTQFSVSSAGGPIPEQLEGGTTVSIRVAFLPNMNGEAAGTLRIDTTDPVTPRIDVSLLAGGLGIEVDDDQDGVSIEAGDCDDQDSTIRPGAPELCDSIDNDCDEAVDEDVATTFYLDSDGDAHGDPETAYAACRPFEGSVTLGDDCDDADAFAFPQAPELCDNIDNDCDGEADDGLSQTFYLDRDADGYGSNLESLTACAMPEGYAAAPDDCNDADASSYPGAQEVCDTWDNNCDNAIDENATLVFYRDGDGDGFGDSQKTATGCVAPTGYVPASGDCDDASSTVYPQAFEACDFVDNDCDTMVDEEGTTLFYLDYDRDGYGDPTTAFKSCRVGTGAVSIDGDCDDATPTTHRGAKELCDGRDNDCDDKIDDGATSVFYEDRDGDGYGDSDAIATGCVPSTGYVALYGDCDDTESSIHPSAEEVCDSIDNDCDGWVDPNIELTWYQDNDGDGHGDPATIASACVAPEEFVADATDCNDHDVEIYASAVEACDLKDNDCDGKIDEDGVQTWYKDIDGDGFGNPDTRLDACGKPEGYVHDKTDCNDHDAVIYPAAAESCDSKDNDCDGAVDEEGVSTFYRDYDKDGQGDPADSRQGCNMPSDFVASSGDCNDRDSVIYSGAVESCDLKDNDCDGTVDEGTLLTWYLDADQDGQGAADTTTQACAQPERYVGVAGDCDDLDQTVYAAASELCDTKDNDCDGGVDEGVEQTFYADIDGDGFGDAAVYSSACSAPRGSVEDNTDCDDSRAQVNPGEAEACDSQDNDCDNQVDEGVQQTYYADGDGDGYGVTSSSIKACQAPAGYAGSSSDCDDVSPASHPGAAELCDGKDNDCDATVDENVRLTFYTDGDSDGFGDAENEVLACALSSGFVANDIDCDDADAVVYPGAAELCDAKDNDCNTRVDEAGDPVQNTYYRDADSDGHGKASPILYGCSVPSGYAASKDDCDDDNADTYPGAVEQCNGDDNNCNGIAGPPAAPTASNNGPVCAGSPIQLKAVGGANFHWTGPSGFDTLSAEPTIPNATTVHGGTYSVTAEVESCVSPAATTTVSVVSPSAAFTSDTTTAGADEPVSFSATAADATYAWTFTGGTPSTSTDRNPQVTWAADGSYLVTLAVMQNGCPAISSVTITIETASEATTCKAIKDSNPSATDGVYTIDPDGAAGPNAPFDTYCDMTTSGGGWMLLYFVDAAHFDGYIANNKVAMTTPITAINGTGEMFTPPAGMAFTETVFGCTQQDDAAKFSWTYSSGDPAMWFYNTTKDYGFPAVTSSSTTSTFTGKCISANKAESGFGFMAIETGTSCGTCQNMLFGNYFYANGGQCNSTDNTYNTHTSPYRAKSIGYPLCNKKQTSNGKFWIGVR